MKISKLNEWLTLISNLAVLIGIGFIWFELNQNEQIIRAQMSQERANLTVSSFDALSTSEFLAEIFAKRREFDSDREWFASLTPEQKQRVRFRYLREINDVRNQHYLYSQGFLAEEVWNASTRGQAMRLVRMAHTIGDREQFEGDPGFRETLRSIAEEENIPFPNEDGFWN